jgi:hypothetical protein
VRAAGEIRRGQVRIESRSSVEVSWVVEDVVGRELEALGAVGMEESLSAGTLVL